MFATSLKKLLVRPNVTPLPKRRRLYIEPLNPRIVLSASSFAPWAQDFGPSLFGPNSGAGGSFFANSERDSVQNQRQSQVQDQSTSAASDCPNDNSAVTTSSIADNSSGISSPSASTPSDPGRVDAFPVSNGLFQQLSQGGGAPAGLTTTGTTSPADNSFNTTSFNTASFNTAPATCDPASSATAATTAFIASPNSYAGGAPAVNTGGPVAIGSNTPDDDEAYYSAPPPPQNNFSSLTTVVLFVPPVGGASVGVSPSNVGQASLNVPSLGLGTSASSLLAGHYSGDHASAAPNLVSPNRPSAADGLVSLTPSESTGPAPPATSSQNATIPTLVAPLTTNSPTSPARSDSTAQSPTTSSRSALSGTSGTEQGGLITLDPPQAADAQPSQPLESNGATADAKAKEADPAELNLAELDRVILNHLNTDGVSDDASALASPRTDGAITLNPEPLSPTANRAGGLVELVYSPENADVITDASRSLVAQPEAHDAAPTEIRIDTAVALFQAFELATTPTPQAPTAVDASESSAELHAASPPVEVSPSESPAVSLPAVYLPAAASTDEALPVDSSPAVALPLEAPRDVANELLEERSPHAAMLPTTGLLVGAAFAIHRARQEEALGGGAVTKRRPLDIDAN